MQNATIKNSCYNVRAGVPGAQEKSTTARVPEGTYGGVLRSLSIQAREYAEVDRSSVTSPLLFAQQPMTKPEIRSIFWAPRSDRQLAYPLFAPGAGQRQGFRPGRGGLQTPGNNGTLIRTPPPRGLLLLERKFRAVSGERRQKTTLVRSAGWLDP